MINKFLILVFLFNFIISINAVEKVVIIGKGAAGSTAAIFTGQALLSPYVVEGGECGGQLATVSFIENYPGFPEGISGEELADRMRQQAERFGTTFLDRHVIKVNFLTYPFEITLDNGQILSSYSVIIATGSSPRWLDVPHEAALKGRGVSASALCDRERFIGMSVVVAGGGDAALEQALLLAECAAHVTIIHRGDHVDGAPYLVERVTSDPRIELLLGHKIQKVAGEEVGWVQGVYLENLATHKETFFPCQGLFVSIGRKPNTDLFLGQLEMDERGLIQTNGSASSVPGVFVAGDIMPHAQRKIITAAASGCIAASGVIEFLKARSLLLD